MELNTAFLSTATDNTSQIQIAASTSSSAINIKVTEVTSRKDIGVSPRVRSSLSASPLYTRSYQIDQSYFLAEAPDDLIPRLGKSPRTPVSPAMSYPENADVTRSEVGSIRTTTATDMSERAKLKIDSFESMSKRRLPLTLALSGRISYISRLIEKKTQELNPAHIESMGPIVTFSSVASLRSKSKQMQGPLIDIRTWRPKGRLVARMLEHSGPINQMALAPDHKFFVSCSDDGSVSIFDTKRLERNPVNKSLLKVSNQGGRIKCVNFCEDSHSIVSASTNGTIHISRIEYIDSSKYTSNAFQNIQLDDDYVLAIDHCNRGMFPHYSRSPIFACLFHL